MDVDQREMYKLAYEEAVRGLAHQQSRLDDFRARAGIVLSAAAIATSLLGGQALNRESPTLWAWIALACFIGVSALALLLLVPRRWIFTAVPRRIIRTYVETPEPLPLPMIHRDLALHMEDSYVENELGLDKMITRFRLALVLLALEVVSWTVEIATRS
jgi:hypothetical protein